jgi:hypothetical protein
MSIIAPMILTAITVAFFLAYVHLAWGIPS